jgi:hypothetical protein
MGNTNSLKVDSGLREGMGLVLWGKQRRVVQEVSLD